MTESAKVRLVRCPKCENLLPELADYSVYQCGGCGAVLRAKTKCGEGDNLSDKLNEETAGIASAKLENSLEKRTADSGEALKSDAKLISGSFRRDQSSIEAEKDNNRNGDIYRTHSNVDEECIAEYGLDRNLNRRDKLERELVDLNTELGSTTDFRRSGRMTNFKLGASGEMEDFRRNVRGDVEGVRFSTSNYHDEGPSNYHMGSLQGFNEPMKKHAVTDDSRARYLEQDRAALLRKLDELRDQLSRSCEASDIPKEKVPLEGRGRIIPPDSYSGSDSRPFMPNTRPDKHTVGSPNFGHFPEPITYNNGYEMPSNNCYPNSLAYPNRVTGYGDPFGPLIHKGVSHHFPRPYHHQPSQSYFSGQYIDNSPELFEPYAHNPTCHHPSCHCFYCYDNYRRASAAPNPPPPYLNNRFGDAPSNSMQSVGPSDPNKSRNEWRQNMQSQARWPSDFDHETGLARGRGRRAVYPGSRRFQPVGGGAPFMSCSNCFEVLRLPEKVRLVDKTRHKLKCGACSTVMDVALVDKKIVITVSSEKVRSPTDVTNGAMYSHGHMNRSYAFSSDDYDNSGYDFQAMDREPGKPQETQSFHSSSRCTSEGENSSDVTNSAQHPMNADFSPPPPGSPLQDHFDYSTKNHLENRLGKGNRSSRSDHEKVRPSKINSRQNSLNKASLATEMEVSYNEYSNTGISQDSGDRSKSEDPPRTNKGGESFFSNIIKKSFKDFSRPNQADERGKINVTINGHPITDRILKKAQKLAGPVHPGQYWYDYRAGFWGIIGGPCLGIVLPHIEEFNYPIPENCSGGTTGVFVNGRELHQKDLDLLASRGLPTSRDRSYIVEISGRVLDEDTGDELDGLGKLAPTVEKAKHGFGMKAPKVVQTN